MNSRDSGIYSITSKLNGKRYIGSATRICKRWGEHLSALRNNRHHSQYLQNHFNKYSENDLIFTVLEVIDRGELSLQDFKKLLLNREQAYLNNWEECHFNCRPTAGSGLGHKKAGSKYYSYNTNKKQYMTYFAVSGKTTAFSYHHTEEEAIEEVEFLKTLTDQQLLDYKKECVARPQKSHRDTRNYAFNNDSGRYNIYYKVDRKNKYFGSCATEVEAVKEVEYIKTLTDEELLNYKQEYLGLAKLLKKVESKGYSFDKHWNRWRVRFAVNGKQKHFGYYATEQEAKDKAAEAKKELGIL